MINKNQVFDSKRIKIIRKSVGLTQFGFAEVASISQAQVSAMEQDSIKVGVDIIEKVCKSFNVDPNWLLFGNGEMFVSQNDYQNPDIQKKTVSKTVSNAVSNAEKTNQNEIGEYSGVATIENKPPSNYKSNEPPLTQFKESSNAAQMPPNKVLNDILTVLTGLQAEVINLKGEVSRLSQAKDTTKLP